MQRGDWSIVDYHRAFGEGVPIASGLYAIVQSKRVLGMPISTTPLYIGKSKNLRRRFAEHTDPFREHNRALNDAVAGRDLEFWFVTIPHDQLGEAERTAIRALNPITNVIRY